MQKTNPFNSILSCQSPITIQLRSQGAFKKLPLNIKGRCMPTHSLSYDCPRSGAGCESILLAVCAVEHDKTFRVKYSQRPSLSLFIRKSNIPNDLRMGLCALCSVVSFFQVSLEDQAIHPSTKRSMLTSWSSPATVRKKCLEGHVAIERTRKARTSVLGKLRIWWFVNLFERLCKYFISINDTPSHSTSCISRPTLAIYDLR